MQNHAELRLVTMDPEEVRRLPPGRFTAMGTSGLEPTEVRAVLHALTAHRMEVEGSQDAKGHQASIFCGPVLAGRHDRDEGVRVVIALEREVWHEHAREVSVHDVDVRPAPVRVRFDVVGPNDAQRDLEAFDVFMVDGNIEVQRFRVLLCEVRAHNLQVGHVRRPDLQHEPRERWHPWEARDSFLVLSRRLEDVL